MIDSPAEPHWSGPYEGAVWLCQRYPRVRHLAQRLGAVQTNPDGSFKLLLDRIGEIVAAVPAYGAAWRDYEDRHPAPQEDADYDRWAEQGPSAEEFAPALSAFLPMSSGEVALVRLLGALSGVRVPFCVSDTNSLDQAGQQFLADWCRVLRDN